MKIQVCNRWLKYFRYPICLIFVFTSLSFAEYIPPGEIKVKTESYKPENISFPEGTYQYEVAWQGIPVAQAKVVVNDRQLEGNPFFFVQANAKTSKLIDVFYRLRHNSESLFNAKTLEPARFVSNQKENSRKKDLEIQFAPGGLIKARSINNGKESQLEFFSDNLTLDPISAAFVARSLPINEGQELSFDVFNGKHRYLISFKVEGRESLELNDHSYDAFKVVPSVTKLSDTDGETRLQGATIWVSCDDSRDVLKLESKVLIGKVSAKLLSFTPITKVARTEQ